MRSSGLTTFMDIIRLPSRLKKYIFAGVIGNGLEWYDFVIFGYFSPVFSKLFFPEESQFATLIDIFIIFAIGLLSRPIGAYLFGKLADQQGRKKALLLSVLLMAFSTSFIGLLPTYFDIGILAPILLTLLRICQGISMGGEFTSSLTFLIEHSPPSRKGLVGAWIYSGGFLGSALGAVTVTMTTLCMPAEQLQTWGWRLPFFLGIGIAFLGYFLRMRLNETPAFLELKHSHTIEKSPFRQVFKEKRMEILSIIGIILPNTVWMYLLFVFLPNYLTQIMQWDFTLSLLINLIPLGILMVLLPVIGHASDLWGRKRIILSGQILLLISAPIALNILSSDSFSDILFLQIFISLALTLSCGPMAALLTEMFPASLRNTGVSISYNTATGVFGGMTPLLLTSLISLTGGMLWPTLWVTSTVLIGMIALVKVKGLRGRHVKTAGLQEC